MRTISRTVSWDEAMASRGAVDRRLTSPVRRIIHIEYTRYSVFFLFFTGAPPMLGLSGRVVRCGKPREIAAGDDHAF
jgi:hypothetical protein